MIGLVLFVNKNTQTEWYIYLYFSILPNTPRIPRTESFNNCHPRFTITDMFLSKSFGVFTSLSLTELNLKDTSALPRSQTINPFVMRNNNVRDKV